MRSQEKIISVKSGDLVGHRILPALLITLAALRIEQPLVETKSNQNQPHLILLKARYLSRIKVLGMINGPIILSPSIPAQTWELNMHG